MSKKIKGVDKVKSNTPIVLQILKTCRKYNIDHYTIKNLSYNDLLYLIIDFQTDEINKALDSKNENKQTKRPASTSEKTELLLGYIPENPNGK